MTIKEGSLKTSNFWSFATRGSVWKKFNSKRFSELDSVIGFLQTKYNIDGDVRDSNVSLSPDLITIPRIAACFPFKICDYFHLGYGKVLYTAEDLGFPDNTAAPKALFCTFVTAALIRTLRPTDKSLESVIEQLKLLI